MQPDQADIHRPIREGRDGPRAVSLAWKMCLARDHADDYAGLVSDDDMCSDRRLALRKESRGQPVVDDERCNLRGLVRGNERSASERPYAEDVEVVRRDAVDARFG